ncbi:MAG TPA: FAD-binding oxidoreductase [Thermoleophilaceae bacterium]
MTTAPQPQFDLQPLRTALAGTLTTAADSAWDTARQAWNLAVDQQPAAVVHAVSAADVTATVNVARELGLPVAVQGSGHGAAPLGPLDGTLLLRTGRMDGLRIDPAARVARAEAGALWGPVAIGAGEHGLAALAGSSIDVGVVGYTLGGGIGWLARSHGLACNRVRAIELVTADGESRRVDHEGEPELFWALRGGGGSFGAVTAVEFELVELPEVYAGALFWPAAASAEVLHAYREWARAVPEQLTSIIRLLRLPPLPEVPEPLRDTPVIDLGFAYAGDPAEGEQLIRPLRELAPTLIDTCGAMPAAELRGLHGDPEQPVPGIGNHTMIADLSADAVDALLGVAGHESGSPLLGVELRQLGGALARAEDGHGALATLEGEYALYGVGVPMTPGLAQAIPERLEAVVETMAPWSTGGSYLNFGDAPGQDTGTAFDAETYARLRAVKRSFDPDDLFRSNHPIPAAD